MNCPVHRVEALVLGSGAAGLRAAVELKRQNVDVAVCSTGLFSGTSACSGSDKQTLHTAGTSNRGDDFVKLANDIGSGGAMDKDTAYIEAVGSIGAFAGLQYLGLPLPQDRFGAVLRYQTDHDDVGRATSCTPYPRGTFPVDTTIRRRCQDRRRKVAPVRCESYGTDGGKSDGSGRVYRASCE